MASAAKFDPLRAQPEPAFFKDASEQKLHKWRLDDGPRPFTARLRPSIVSQGVVRFDEASFGDSVEAAGTDRFSPVVPGTMLCFNTVEEFKTCDKKAIIANAGASVLRSILSGAATEDPGNLCQTLALVHLGIKSHRYVIWPAFPALVPASTEPVAAVGSAQDPAACVRQIMAASPAESASADDSATDSGVALLLKEAVGALISKSPHGVLPLVFGLVIEAKADHSGAAGAATDESCVEAVSLAELEARASASASTKAFRAQLESGSVMLVVADPGSSAEHAGWTARNALMWASLRLAASGSTVSVLCMRPGADGGVVSGRSGGGGGASVLRSIVVRYKCPATTELGSAAAGRDGALATMADWCGRGSGQELLDAAGVSVTGWELQPVKGKGTMVPRPRVFNLAALMDKRMLVETAARLNLSLMKWRVLPTLAQEELEELSCLLLGAGTLGCHVARCLMAWGVRNITFVDNGKVSYSNPVRQPLFEFEDVAGSAGPKFKAEAAAAAMKRIFPACRARGAVLTIPMPGHAEDVEQALVDAAELAELIRSHDVVFALTDTRESRWLPTALCRRFNKPLLNVALGFDSWLVMRHGVDSTRLVQGRMCPVAGSPGAASAAGGAASSGESLCGPATAGCYFCSDVVAPLNSMTGRTLDQQCTVTRPGLAPIAASHAVELLVNLLHHPLRAAAPTPERAPRKDTAASASSEPDEAAASALAGTASAASGSSTGAVPHQLRGFIADFSVLKLEQESFDCCSACSPAIVNLLDADMPGFLRRVLADPDVLETESGLERIKAEAEAMAGDWDGDDASW